MASIDAIVAMDHISLIFLVSTLGVQFILCMAGKPLFYKDHKLDYHLIARTMSTLVGDWFMVTSINFFLESMENSKSYQMQLWSLTSVARVPGIYHNS